METDLSTYNKTTMGNENLNTPQNPPLRKHDVLGDALDQLVIKIDQLIKDEEKCNPKQLDECSWNYQVGILITANEAKLLLKVLDEMKMFHLKAKTDEKHRR